MTIVGTVTDEGIECTAVRGDDGVLYTLATATVRIPLAAGMRVRVVGTVAAVSNCQQGTTLNVETIEPIAR